MPDFVNLIPVEDVPDGRGVTVRQGERQLAVFHLDGEYYVLDGTCPHVGGPLGEGWVENGIVSCPLHGWDFEIKTGACKTVPSRPAKCFTARVVDGQVQVALEANR